jgi:hypothetical protein
VNPRLTLALLYAAGCNGEVSEPMGFVDDDDPIATPEPFEPAAAVLPRLTALQYRESLEDLFGSDLPPTPVQVDTNPMLFYSIGATSTSLAERGAQQYADAAAAVTDVIFADPTRREALMGCRALAPGDVCVDGFLRVFGRKLFRRPLTDDEHARWLAVATDAAEGDADRGVRLALFGMLQSPSFVYRVEVGEPDPDDSSRYRYTSYEMAQRISYLLWNTTPDEELLDAAERGDLLTDAGIEAQAMRLLEDERARRAVQAFFAQYLDLGRLNDVSRDPAVYSLYTDTLTRSMRTEVELLVDDLVFRSDGDIRGIFSSRRTFVNDELAALYGVDAPGATAVAFVPIEFGDDVPRAGVLTSGAFLAMNAHPTETSPTLRGKYVRERVLCQPVPPPPGDVNLDLMSGAGRPPTLRERLELHRTNPVCATCHAFIDPPGFLFEHYDSIGVYREEAEGHPVDASGDLDGQPLENARELAERLRDDPRVGDCMVKQLYRHANGRIEDRSEQAALEELNARFAAVGFRFRDLLIELVLSEGFRTLAAPEVRP